VNRLAAIFDRLLENRKKSSKEFEPMTSTLLNNVKPAGRNDSNTCKWNYFLHDYTI